MHVVVLAVSIHLSIKLSMEALTVMQMIAISELSMGKKLAVVGQAGKLWRWKRSHHQWLLQFKWKWQKPWRLSEWIRHSDETIMRARPRPRPHPLSDMMWYHHINRIPLSHTQLWSLMAHNSCMEGNKQMQVSWWFSRNHFLTSSSCWSLPHGHTCIGINVVASYYLKQKR